MTDPSGQNRLLSRQEMIDIFVRHRVASPFPGDWESIFRGSGYEFWSLREMVAGDSVRSVDWKATAKTGRHYVREYLAESGFNLMILCDISQSVAFGRKALLQANIATALAFAAAKTNNGCGLILFADDVRACIPPRMGWDHFRRVADALLNAVPVACPTTDLNRALARLVTELPESLTFILSDFLYPFESRFSFRAPPGPQRHEVRAIQVLETSEVALPPGSEGLLRLRDSETGETRMLDLSRWAQYNADMKKRLAAIREQVNRAGIELLRLTPADNFITEINAFMR
ncbi:DUF58 domain-containing protein [Desulfonema ishimotonii]|uniref:DUF58 domain-containing protein n=1 Tax=Desulfonema ishimotonii TaxID=45657 RepID=A0A401FX09_9BACT|nr:DUF58 domain-containing protein [Desulfonema ishimotonii]GBC61479.1 DUF58 domain-containing protein [Desulfonema ishimotonii]